MSCTCEATNTYDLGQDVTIYGEWKTTAGELVDPAGTVRCKVKKPDETITTYTYGVDAAVEKVQDGQYRMKVNGSQAGTWFYRWYSDGVGAGADENEFVIARSQFG